jgi:hypothetical protein
MLIVSQNDWKPDVCDRKLCLRNAVATPPTIRATVRVNAYRVTYTGNADEAKSVAHFVQDI